MYIQCSSKQTGIVNKQTKLNTMFKITIKEPSRRNLMFIMCYYSIHAGSMCSELPLPPASTPNSPLTGLEETFIRAERK